MEYELIYYCSFESPEDTTGWHGITEEMFVDDPAPGCGKKSLLLEGGCLQPAAWRVLDTEYGSSLYKLSCWGKKGTDSGNVRLTIIQNHRPLAEIMFTIDSETWRFYQAEKVLPHPPGSKVQLELRVGGFVYQNMFIDGLKIEKSRRAALQYGNPI